MDVKKILQEISDNPIEVYQPMEEDPTTKLLVKGNQYSVANADKKEIIISWLSGTPAKEIANKYNLTTRAVNLIIENNEETRLELEKKYFAVQNAKENFKIARAKDDIISFVTSSIKEAQSADEISLPISQKLKYLASISNMLDKIDNISRLNKGESTNNTTSTSTNINVDVAEIMKTLKTPEEKLEFLQKQSEKYTQNTTKFGKNYNVVDV